MTEGSTLAFDFWPPSLTEDSGDPAFKTRRRRYARLGESLQFGIEAEALQDFVGPFGYEVQRIESFNSLSQRYANRHMHSPEGMSVASIVAVPRPVSASLPCPLV